MCHQDLFYIPYWKAEMDNVEVVVSTQYEKF